MFFVYVAIVKEDTSSANSMKSDFTFGHVLSKFLHFVSPPLVYAKKLQTTAYFYIWLQKFQGGASWVVVVRDLVVCEQIPTS